MGSFTTASLGRFNGTLTENLPGTLIKSSNVTFDGKSIGNLDRKIKKNFDGKRGDMEE